jgi:hypothetical protein
VLPRTSTATFDVDTAMKLDLERKGLRSVEVSVLSEAEQ